MNHKRRVELNRVDAAFFLGAVLIAVGVGVWLGVGPGLVAAGGLSLFASFLMDGGPQEGGEDGE